MPSHLVDRYRAPAHGKMLAPLNFPLPPMAFMGNTIATPMRQLKQKHAVATFVVSGMPDREKDIIKAVYMDLIIENPGAKIELRESPEPYIRVECSTEEDAAALIDMAQQMTTSYISGGSPDPKPVFAEPPASRKTDDFRVVVKVDPATKQGRPILAAEPSTSSTETQVLLERYTQGCSSALCGALEKAACLHFPLDLKMHLGKYRLQVYKAGKFTLEQFEQMVQHPRAAGKLDTCLGLEPSVDGFSADVVMGWIRAPGSPCFPMDNQAESPAQVTPVYILETWYNNTRYETDLEIAKSTKKRSQNFKLVRTKAFLESSQAPKFEITSISVGRMLDWAIKATPSHNEAKTPPAVRGFLEGGWASMTDCPQDYRSYPTISLPKGYPSRRQFKSIAIKSVYRYKWKDTGYVVQFTINRRWRNIRHMSQDASTFGTDFDVKVYAANWSEGTRLEAGQAMGRVWGKDLQSLLRMEAGDASGSALSKVQGLIKTIMDVRDFFEGPSRNSKDE